MNEKFLDAFRALDTELKTEGKTVLEYENSLNTIEQEKLKVCRIMRNYMAHNDMNFICATNEQIKFLNQQFLEIRKMAHTVKDEMKKIKPIKYTEPIKNVIMQILKFLVVPIDTKLGIYLVDKDILLKQLASGNKKIEIPTRLPKYKTVSMLERIEDIQPGIYIVVNENSYIGLYIK